MEVHRSKEATTARRKDEVRGDLVPAMVGVELIAQGLANPVALATPPDGTGRLFIVDQVGKVHVVSPPGGTRETFLDISSRLVDLDPKYDERGLLGMAFHPRFQDNGRFYLFFSGPLRPSAPRGWNCTNYLVEMTAPHGSGKVEVTSMRVLLAIDKPQMNHNGGHIAFGPDGLLYIPLGDGGHQNDQGEGHTEGRGNAQDLEVLLGKVLRIDVDGRSDGREYAIPQDNPFVDGPGRPEIFAYGLRNPYHIAFDAGGDHALYAGDVGQGRWEEVDIIVRGGNYGWNLREGRHHFNPEDNMGDYLGPNDRGYRGEELIDPILEYRNLSSRTGGSGSAIIGGYVYRGRALPYLRGRYIFGDFSGRHGAADGRLYVGTPPVHGSEWTMDELRIEGRGKLKEYLLGIGQDADHELYVLSSSTQGPEGSSGRVYRIVPAGQE